MVVATTATDAEVIAASRTGARAVRRLTRPAVGHEGVTVVAAHGSIVQSRSHRSVANRFLALFP